MTSGNFNYTNRRGIKNVRVDIIERDENFIRVKTSIDIKPLKDQKNVKLVLDGFDRGNLERKVLEFVDEQVNDFNEFEIQSKPVFRIKLVSTDKENLGAVLAATKEVRPREVAGNLHKDEFLKPIPKDLGDIPWRIDWEGGDGNPEILINTKLLHHFKDWKNPTLQAMFLPTIVKELLLGILARWQNRDELEKESLAAKIMAFGNDRLGREYPDEPFSDADENCVNSSWLTWVDEVVQDFCEMRWRQDKTLFEQMLEDI